MTEPKTRRKLPLTAITQCWYAPGETTIIDLIHPDDGLTLHFKESAHEIQARYPAAQVMAFEEAWKLAETVAREKYRKDVTEIDQQRFLDALNVLPPVGWTTRQGVELFRISERLWGNLTDIYARYGTRYFTLTDDMHLSADIIADRVRDFALKQPDLQVATATRPLSDARASAHHPAPKPDGEA